MNDHLNGSAQYEAWCSEGCKASYISVCKWTLVCAKVGVLCEVAEEYGCGGIGDKTSV